MKKLTKEQIIERAIANSRPVRVTMTAKQVRELFFMVLKRAQEIRASFESSHGIPAPAMDLYRIARTLEAGLKVTHKPEAKRRSRPKT